MLAPRRSGETLGRVRMLALVGIALGLATGCGDARSPEPADSHIKGLREDCPTVSPPPEGRSVEVLCRLDGKLPRRYVIPPSSTSPAP